MPEVKYAKVLTQMVAPLASERPATNIYERWETADCPARNERRGLSAYSGEFVEAWEAVYQHRMEVNGVLPPFNHESRTYKALVKKAEAAPKVRRGLSAQLDALTGEADNRDLFGDREKYADAVQARALQQMESLKRIRSYESDACNAKRRLSFSSAVELVGELVEQLLRAKMSTAGDGRAWLPACTDPLTGVGGWGPPLNVMHADLSHPQTPNLMGRPPTPAQDRTTPSPTPGSSSAAQSQARTRLGPAIQAIEDALDGGRGGAMRQAREGGSGSGGPVPGPWMIGNVAGEGGQVAFPGQSCRRSPARERRWSSSTTTRPNGSSAPHRSSCGPPAIGTIPWISDDPMRSWTPARKRRGWTGPRSRSCGRM